ncbi:hypothetical protein HDR63_04135 [bacterium]|nr:hypothetical protein [bacterium]
MKVITRFFVMAVALAPMGVWAAVPTTAGSNLTAYNPTNMGSVANNNWNNLTNPRAGGAAPTADFGNCNALIMRCAQPKCASGGCSSMDVAVPIVSGCVQSNDTCKKYGDDLTQYIAAQLVATSTARANDAANAAATAAAQAQAAQSAQQMQQMQAQMQQMQTQMAQQNAAATQQLQAALEEQKQLTAQALAQAEASAAQAAAAAQMQTTAPSAAPSVSDNLTQAQVAAANAGVSADILVREQVSGQIMSKIENATVAMKTLKATMESAFAYAGCDRTGNNCSGPRRVKAFKEKALPFFDDYNAVLNEIYSAIVTAQAVGVDLTDIYLMLSGTCHVWGKYLCEKGKDIKSGECQLIQTLTDQDEVQQNWLYGEEEGKGQGSIKIGCVSDALNNSVLFRNMKKEASIDVQTLQRMIEQDAPNTLGSSRYTRNRTAADIQMELAKYCGVNDNGTRNGIADYDTLVQAVTLRKLPNTKVCVSESELDRAFVPFTSGTGKSLDSLTTTYTTQSLAESGLNSLRDNSTAFSAKEIVLKQSDSSDSKKSLCSTWGGEWDSKLNYCSCSKITDPFSYQQCLKI